MVVGVLDFFVRVKESVPYIWHVETDAGKAESPVRVPQATAAAKRVARARRADANCRGPACLQLHQPSGRFGLRSHANVSPWPVRFVDRSQQR